MGGIKARMGAVVDVTRPAFEGVEGWSEAVRDECGMAVATVFLEDNGFEVIDHDGAAVIARDGGATYAVHVSSRRELGDVADGGHSIGCGIRRRREIAARWGERTVQGALLVTFLSDRLAKLDFIRSVGPE